MDDSLAALPIGEPVEEGVGHSNDLESLSAWRSVGDFGFSKCSCLEDSEDNAGTSVTHRRQPEVRRIGDQSIDTAHR